MRMKQDRKNSLEEENAAVYTSSKNSKRPTVFQSRRQTWIVHNPAADCYRRRVGEEGKTRLGRESKVGP